MAGKVGARDQARIADVFHRPFVGPRDAGPGELLGQAQSGAALFKFADLTRDLELAKLARDLVASQPKVARLASPPA